jgi:hypothetical protein
MRLCVSVLIVLTHSAVLLTTAAAAPDCASQAAALDSERENLPRLELASPRDRPPYCITLETNMAFALRVKAHVAQCPNSAYAQMLAEWDKTRTSYGKLFNQHRCKRTL